MAKVFEAGVTLAKSLMPPNDNNQNKLYWWRVRLGIVTVGTFIGLGLFVAVAYGAVPWLNSGFATRDMVEDFARRDKVETLTKTVEEIRITQNTMRDDALERDIRDLWSRYCSSKDGLRTEYDRQLSADFILYRKRNGWDHPPLRECP